LGAESAVRRASTFVVSIPRRAWTERELSRYRSNAGRSACMRSCMRIYRPCSSGGQVRVPSTSESYLRLPPRRVELRDPVLRERGRERLGRRARRRAQNRRRHVRVRGRHDIVEDGEHACATSASAPWPSATTTAPSRLRKHGRNAARARRGSYSTTRRARCARMAGWGA
jgi:hypothetical protein